MVYFKNLFHNSIAVIYTCCNTHLAINSATVCVSVCVCVCVFSTEQFAIPSLLVAITFNMLLLFNFFSALNGV